MATETEYVKLQRRIANLKPRWKHKYLYTCQECQGSGNSLRFVKNLYAPIELLNRGKINAGWDAYIHAVPQIVLKGEEGHLQPWNGKFNISINTNWLSESEILLIAKKIKQARTKKFWQDNFTLSHPHNEWFEEYSAFLSELAKREKAQRVREKKKKKGE